MELYKCTPKKISGRAIHSRHMLIIPRNFIQPVFAILQKIRIAELISTILPPCRVLNIVSLSPGNNMIVFE